MSNEIVHIAPHYGGGVGTVVRSLLESQLEAGYLLRLIAFESINQRMQDWARQYAVPCLENANLDGSKLNEWLSRADIVHLHWWNHPLLMQWMSDSNRVVFRCVLWSHVNGMHEPQAFFRELVTYPDQFVVATPYSLESEWLKNQLHSISIVQSAAKVKIFPSKPLRNLSMFTVGFIGTVDTIKMHPAFIDLCLNVAIPNAKFIVCGGPRHQELQNQVQALGKNAFFDIRGPVDNVEDVWTELDVLGYPLNSGHYGTGEQVLLEAMGAGVVPVVLDSGCERYIVEDGKTGIIAKSLDEYSAAISYLYLHADKRREMSESGRQKMQESSKKTLLQEWSVIYQHLLTVEKRHHTIPKRADLLNFSAAMQLVLQAYAGTDLSNKFINLLGRGRRPSQGDFSLGVFSATRGSPYHYLRFFPQDFELQALCKQLDSYKNKEFSL